MSKLCVFGTIGNAGMSFTDATKANLVKMYDYTCTCDDVVDYAMFQKKISENCDVSESNVRMYSPFLYAHGFINDYKNGAQIKTSEYFTSLGKAFVKSLIVTSKIENKVCQEKSLKITQDILALSMLHRKINRQKDYYFDFLMFCLKYGSISLNEFNYMLYEKEVIGNEDYVERISETIRQFRDNEIDFDFQQDRNSKKGERVRKPLPDNTFNYTRNLLVETGLIVETNDRRYKINPDKMRVVRILVEED